MIPDAPIGYFKLDLLGGKQGYLVNTRSLCASPPRVEIAYTAQSGKQTTQKIAAKTACGHKQGTQEKQATLTNSPAIRGPCGLGTSADRKVLSDALWS